MYFRSGSGIRTVDTATGSPSFSVLTTLTGLSRAGDLQVTGGDGAPVRFRIGATTTTARTEVEFPAPSDSELDGVAISGNGAAVVFQSQNEFYRWKTSGELHYLQPRTSAAAGDPRDVSITGRFVLTSRPGATNGILEIVDLSGPEIPIVASEILQGPQLGDQIRRLYLAYFDRQPDQCGILCMEGRSGQRGIARCGIDRISRLRPSSRTPMGHSTTDNSWTWSTTTCWAATLTAAGRSFWMSRLQAGATRGSVMTGFSEGEEFRNRTGTTAAANAPLAHRSSGSIVPTSTDRPIKVGLTSGWNSSLVVPISGS